jgi:hypothetical protein
MVETGKKRFTVFTPKRWITLFVTKICSNKAIEFVETMRIPKNEVRLSSVLNVWV